MDIFYLFVNKYDCFGEKKYEREHNAGLYLVEYAGKHFFNMNNIAIEKINNKPVFINNNDLYFSISHSNNITAVCFDRYNVGFDIEFMKERDYKALSERMNFKLKLPTKEKFYKYWTQYEAEYKLQVKAKNMKSIIFNEQYAISVASSSSNMIKLNFHLITKD